MRLRGKYILFKDLEGVRTSGYIYKVDGDNLSIFTVRTSARGERKTYYYTVKEEEVIKVISQQEAIEFSHK